MLIIFSQGRDMRVQDKPLSYLSKIAKNAGSEVITIDDRDLNNNPTLRAQRLIDLVKKTDQKIILVGFSMGGYTSMLAYEQAREKVQGAFLIAPALYLENENYPQKNYAADLKITLIHGLKDNIVPYQNSLKYAQLSNNILHLLPSNHLMLDQLDLICNLFVVFLKNFGINASYQNRK